MHDMWVGMLFFRQFNALSISDRILTGFKSDYKNQTFHSTSKIQQSKMQFGLKMD